MSTNEMRQHRYRHEKQNVSNFELKILFYINKSLEKSFTLTKRKRNSFLVLMEPFLSIHIFSRSSFHSHKKQMFIQYIFKKIKDLGANLI